VQDIIVDWMVFNIVVAGLPSEIESKLRSTMSQDRLEALMLSAVEKDLLLGLKDANLAATFATKADRRMLLC